MTDFSNMTVSRKANVYFGGQVTSRTLLGPDGSRMTLGVMLPGEYTFQTDSAERMEITAGDLEVLLPDAECWREVGAGGVFEVPGNASFSLKVKEVTDYCCFFIK